MRITELQYQLTNNSFCHIRDFRSLIDFNPEEKSEFKNFWSRLRLDQNFKNYTHRERRILRYRYKYNEGLKIDYNSEYNSQVTYDIEYTQGANQLTYVEEEFINNPLLQRILVTDIKIVEDLLDKQSDYMINIHLFRVVSNDGKISPTTSGIHRDGMDLICMHYINSENIHPVVSKLYTDNSPEDEILSIRMNNFLEGLIVNDELLYHSASEVQQLNLEQVAFRDLLLITFKKI